MRNGRRNCLCAGRPRDRQMRPRPQSPPIAPAGPLQSKGTAEPRLVGPLPYDAPRCELRFREFFLNLMPPGLEHTSRIYTPPAEGRSVIRCGLLPDVDRRMKRNLLDCSCPPGRQLDLLRGGASPAGRGVALAWEVRRSRPARSDVDERIAASAPEPHARDVGLPEGMGHDAAEDAPHARQHMLVAKVHPRSCRSG